jgi:hypothetical protein
MASRRAVDLGVLVVLVSVGVAKGRPVRSNLGLGIGAGDGLGIGLDLGLGGSGSASSSGHGSGYSALGMVTTPGLPMEAVTGAPLRVVVRACHRTGGQGRAWAQVR